MKQIMFYIILLCAFHLIFQKSYSANNNQPEFQQISYMQGLPGISVVKQIQDHYGIMWIAVEAMGLSRYDGHKFVNFQYDRNNPNSISSNFINDLIEDKSGNIWIATINGLNKYVRDENKFIHFQTEHDNPNSIHNNICNNLYLEGDNLWIGTNDGLSRMDIKNGIFKSYKKFENNELENRPVEVLAVSEYPKGTFWLGTDQGLIKFEISTGDSKVWKNIGETDNEPIHNRIPCLVPDSSGNLWVGTYRGLDRFDLKNQVFNHWKFLDYDQAVYGNEGVNNILIDSEGSIWIGTFSAGLIIIDPNERDYKIINTETGGDNHIKSNHIKYIIEDKVGTFWIGTKFEGIFKLNKKINIFNKWPNRLSLFKDLNSKYFFSFFEDKNDVYWLGSKTEGLYKVDVGNNVIKNYSFNPSIKKSIASNRVISVLRDNKDLIWVGTTFGLELMDEKNETFTMIKKISVNNLFLDSKSTLWVGTNEGIYVVNQGLKTVELFKTNENCAGLFRNNLLDILDIFQDSKGQIWFTSRNNGVYCYDYSLNILKHYTKDENSVNGLNSNLTRFCFEDTKGNIWIGTKAGGVNKYNPTTDSFSNYTMDDGLPSNLILCMEEDDAGNMWFGTHNGISKFNVENETFENFNSDYGLKSNIIERKGSWKFSNNELLFGGNDGFNIFYPEDIKKLESETPILITSVKVLDKLILQDIDSFAFIENKFNENYISFEFTLMDFNNPYLHEYEYFLEGFDDNWKKNGNRNYVSYTSLPPGDYVFRVRAANELGNWSDSAPVCKIVINPPVYKLWWFRLLMMLVLVSGFIFLYVQKTNSIKRMKVKLEGMILERTFKLEKAYGELLEKNQLISDQKKEIELQQSVLENKVLERTLDLEKAKKKAEESDHLKSSFLANMSHEIRTPLNAICGFSSMMNDESTDSEMREQYAEIININSKHLLNLIEDILDISKIEAGQLKIVNSLFNVNQLMSDIYKIYIEEIKKKGKNDLLFICPVLDNNLINVDLNSDQLRLKQVIVNLLNNALKFTSKGYIEFGYEIEGAFLRFYVKDTGIGISKENLDLIFDRFTKVEKNNAIFEGTGIGLSISKSIVRLFGGDFFVESEFGEGTKFSFTVPYKA